MLSLSQMIVLLTLVACHLEPQQAEDKALGKLGKGIGRGASKLANISSRVSDLVKGGSKIDHDKLIDLLKHSSKSRYHAARAFQLALEEPLSKLDTAIQILKKASKDSNPLILEAQSAAHANISKEITAARRAAVQHNATIEAISTHNEKITTSIFNTNKKARTINKENAVDLNTVMVNIKSHKLDEWSLILKEKHPDHFELLKTIPVNVVKSMDMKKIGKEVLIPVSGITVVGGTALHLLRDYLDKKLVDRD